jgi:hypothetical protein
MKEGRSGRGAMREVRGSNPDGRKVWKKCCGCSTGYSSRVWPRWGPLLIKKFFCYFFMIFSFRSGLCRVPDKWYSAKSPLPIGFLLSVLCRVFIECFWGFAECSRHSAKQQILVVRSPFREVGFAAHTAVELALSFIYATDRGPARARGFLVALGRTFGDATMNAAGWRPFCWFPHPTHNKSNTNGSNNGSLKSRGTESHYVIFVWMHN